MLQETFNTLHNRVGVLDKVVNQVTVVSEKNSTEIDRMVATLKVSLQEVIDINKKNVEATSQVLEKVPAMLIDLQKRHLVRTKI